MSDKKNDLGQLDPAFAGFQLINGHIITPNGYAYPPGYIYSIPLRQQQLSDLKRCMRMPRQLLL